MPRHVGGRRIAARDVARRARPALRGRGGEQTEEYDRQHVRGGERPATCNVPVRDKAYTCTADGCTVGSYWPAHLLELRASEHSYEAFLSLPHP